MQYNKHGMHFGPALSVSVCECVIAEYFKGKRFIILLSEYYLYIHITSHM